ncbi:MAG: hypothetical protein INH41_03065 [Myxococcaceae bacterium]|jgi:uncharacterized membrane protein|nr:hypothetical protein [Myxococcaceae bacterium]MCA3011361.1 hypothetical protein [Myxococcaceae bacterium]
MHHGVRTAVLAAVTVCYPLAVWLLRDRVAPRWFALLLMGVVALRWAGLRERAGWLVLPGAAIAGLAVATVWLGDAWPLRWYPVGVNLTLLASFAITLARPPSMAERFARLQAPDLPPFAVAYTRKVTVVWVGFFALNASLAAATAAFGTDAQWALYNGGVAYLLVGVLASTEYLVRRRVRARHAHG